MSRIVNAWTAANYGDSSVTLVLRTADGEDHEYTFTKWQAFHVSEGLEEKGKAVELDELNVDDIYDAHVPPDEIVRAEVSE